MAKRRPSAPAPDAAAGTHDERRGADSFPIVGIGASAGGLEAFTQLLKHLQPDIGMGFVLIQHLDPEHESALTQILSRATSLPVAEVTNELRVEIDHVYVIPPNSDLRIAEGVLTLQPRQRSTPHRPIDSFFEALAEDRSDRAIGVVLSGTASDGTLGLEAIKAEGGITFAQDDSAKYTSMPRSAVAAGCVDLVLSPAGIAQELARIAKHPYVAGRPFEPHATSEATAHLGERTPLPSGGRGAPRTGARRGRARPGGGTVPKGAEEGYKKILLLLRNHSGVDFSLYKSTTIQRRINRRLVINKQDTLEDYARFLRSNAKELDALYSDVLISVTSFFRNPEIFDVLAREVFPKILERRGDDPIRLWVLGCSTGQEAYSLAMAFVETAEKAPRQRRLQVFATDLNEALLDKARHGLYAKSLAGDIAPERLQRFFVEEDGGYRISKMLREMVVFARQNLIADPPFSRMDLISCRNLLIYLEPSMQQKALPTFHYALKPEGYLLLGASESVGGFTDLFEPVDKKLKIYFRKAAPTPAFHRPATREHGEPRRPLQVRLPGAPAEAAGLSGELNAQREADRITVNQFAPPGVLVDARLQILQFRGPTGAFLEPPSGKASFDVLRMAREGLMLPLRAALNQARKENTTARRDNVRVHQNGETREVDLEVIPLKNLRELCFLVLFKEAGQARRAGGHAPPRAPADGGALRQEEERTRIAELETELSETREYLQVMQEQHEAANEELQAANEEVQSANEELQSINEELETSKEELESANEELTTVNEEMSSRNAELDRLNNDLVNLQASTKLAILLLGRNLAIRRFSPQAEKQLDLTATDVGRPVGHLRHHLVLPDAAQTPLDLESLGAEVIASVSEQEREVRDRDGRWHSLRLRPYMTLDNQVDGAVLVLIDIDAQKRSEQAIAAARDYAENTLETVREPLLVLDSRLRVESANRSFYRAFRAAPAETVGKFLYDLGERQWDIPRLRALLEQVLTNGTSIEGFELEHDFKLLGRRTLLLNARGVHDKTQRILLAIEDISDRKQLEQDLYNSEIRYRRLFQTAKDGILILDAQTGKIVDANAFMAGLVGMEADELLGKELHEIGLFKDVQENREAFRELQRTGYLRQEHLPVRHRSGETVEVELVANVYRENRRLVAQCNVRDISQRVEMENQIRRQIAALAGESRRKDEFLAMLSHELRNPLAPILSAVHLLKLHERGREDTVHRQAREIIERQVANLTKLVSDLLEVSRVLSGRIRLNRQAVAVDQLVAHAIETAKPLIEGRRHTLVVHPCSDPLWADADATRMEEVFINLLNNAAKFTDQGGLIEVWCEATPGQNTAEVRVRDNGMGIDEQLLPKIFDLFIQADRSLERSHGGMGIGLSLAQRLVELHGGTIEAHSPPSGETRGSELIVRMPLMSAPEPAEPPSLPAESSPKPEGARVLVVDDNVDLVTMLTGALRHEGYSVQTAYTGPDGLKVARQWRPEIVVLDIGLPGLDGYEVARRLRSDPTQGAARPMRLIALTGYGRDADIALAREAGFDAHLVKPCDFAELEKLIAAPILPAG